MQRHAHVLAEVNLFSSTESECTSCDRGKSYFCYKFRDNGRSVGRIYSKEIVFLSAATLTAVFSSFHNLSVKNTAFLGIIGVDVWLWMSRMFFLQKSCQVDWKYFFSHKKKKNTFEVSTQPPSLTHKSPHKNIGKLKQTAAAAKNQ